MSTDSSDPLDGVDPESIGPGDISVETLCTALSSSNPLVRRRGLEICETFVDADIDHVRPFLDEIASLTADDNSTVALRAIAVLETIVGDEPDALAKDHRLVGLVDAAGAEIVAVQLTAATVLGKLAAERPDSVAPRVPGVLEAIDDTATDPSPSNYTDVVDDEVTRRTIREHEEEERQRRVAGRRTLVNVAVAVVESEPERAIGAVEGAIALFDDDDPIIVGGAVDVLGALAAEKPAAVAPARDQLLECLDHDAVVVRARAVRALGHLGDDAAVPKLRQLAETETDDDVRELASDTAAFLAS